MAEHFEERNKKVLLNLKNESKFFNRTSPNQVDKITTDYYLSTILIAPNKKPLKVYGVGQLLKLKKMNEIVKVHCYLTDINCQHDCILSFKIHDLHNPNVYVYGKFWTKDLITHYSPNTNYFIMGKLLTPKTLSKGLIFNCIWIGCGEENVM